MDSGSDFDFRQIKDYVRIRYGIHFNEEKKSLVTSRLNSVLEQFDLANFSDLLNLVFSDPDGDADRLLIDRLTTNHTYFLREKIHFDYFKNQILPQLAQLETKDLRIWSAGCSTGEEPVTLAMLIDEFFGQQKPNWDTRILATDISSRALGIAEQGIYNQESIENLPDHWKKQYFKPMDPGRSKLLPRVKQEIIYRKFNLAIEKFPFKKKFHLIFCRNVMIYFDQETRSKLIQKFYEQTEPGGYLIIGQSETILRSANPYRYIMPSVYQKEIL